MQTADKLKTPDNLQLTQCTVLSTFTYSALSFSNIEKKLVNNHLKQIYFYTVHVFFSFFFQSISLKYAEYQLLVDLLLMLDRWCDLFHVILPHLQTFFYGIALQIFLFYDQHMIRYAPAHLFIGGCKCARCLSSSY